MAALAGVNSATPSLQSTLSQSRLQQARREADQAEATAQQLRQQANEQEQVAGQANQRVQTLQKSIQAASRAASPVSASVKAPVVLQQDPTYIQTLATVFQLAKPILATDLSPSGQDLVKQSLFEASRTSPTSTPSLQPYANGASNQLTGRLIHITA